MKKLIVGFTLIISMISISSAQEISSSCLQKISDKAVKDVKKNQFEFFAYASKLNPEDVQRLSNDSNTIEVLVHSHEDAKNSYWWCTVDVEFFKGCRVKSSTVTYCQG